MMSRRPLVELPEGGRGGAGVGVEEGLEPGVVPRSRGWGGASGEEEGLQQSPRALLFGGPLEMKPQTQGGSGCLSCSAEFE